VTALSAGWLSSVCSNLCPNRWLMGRHQATP
jgi:hypothetical protein